MKTFAMILIAGVIALSLGGLALAAAPATATASAKTASAPYAVEGKIVKAGKGWVEIEIARVERGEGLKAGAMLRVTENARTRVMQSGKAVAASKLVVGETVRVSGQIVKGAKTTTYTASRVTVLQ